MSVYSGFATRQQQKRYNDYIEATLVILAKRISKIYRAEPCDENKFQNHLLQIHDKMARLEQSKYMEPHHSHVLAGLLQDIQAAAHEDGPPALRYSYFQRQQEQSHQIQRARFNSIDALVREYELAYDRSADSHQSLPSRTDKNPSRLKTSTPEKKKVKLKFRTPQRPRPAPQPSRIPEQFCNRDTLPQLCIQEKQQDLCEKRGESAESPRDGALSPRQFLRRTIMASQSTKPLLSLRARQKYSRKGNQ